MLKTTSSYAEHSHHHHPCTNCITELSKTPVLAYAYRVN
uniref:Uncharacterized protein n=1 Tax=Anguilla anguilla TaxID=7936 RepID=A0A0E9VBV4_ANGAN